MTDGIKQRSWWGIFMTGLLLACGAGAQGSVGAPGEAIPPKRPIGCSEGAITCSEDFLTSISSAVRSAPTDSLRSDLSAAMKQFEDTDYLGCYMTLRRLRSKTLGYPASITVSDWLEYLRPIVSPPRPPGRKVAAPSEPDTPEYRRAKQLQNLYEKGVEAYAKRRLADASSYFYKILELDPRNPSAMRAMRRVQSELQQEQKGAP